MYAQLSMSVSQTVPPEDIVFSLCVCTTNYGDVRSSEARHLNVSLPLIKCNEIMAQI